MFIVNFSAITFPITNSFMRILYLYIRMETPKLILNYVIDVIVVIIHEPFLLINVKILERSPKPSTKLLFQLCKCFYVSKKKVFINKQHSNSLYPSSEQQIQKKICNLIQNLWLSEHVIKPQSHNENRSYSIY